MGGAGRKRLDTVSEEAARSPVQGGGFVVEIGMKTGMLVDACSGLLFERTNKRQDR